MKNLILSYFCICISCIAFAQEKSPLNVRQIVLENGLTVLLNEDHSEPKVYGAVVVKAGSKNDPQGATGTAHYFEHIMFKGTDSIGTLDYSAEKVYLDSISMLYDSLNTTIDAKKRNAIELNINNLSIKASEYAIPNEVDKLIKRYGGTQLNAGTSYDMTMYYNVFPPNQMERWLNIYAERFRNPVFRLFQSELETVYEERNMYSIPIGKMMEDLLAAVFKNHPYGKPIIGTVKDLKNPSISKMNEFYHDYYVANNMALVLVGDFDTDKLLPLLEEKFGKWQKGNIPEFPKEKYKEEPFKGREFISGKYMPIRFGAVVYRGIPNGHPDEVALNFACQIMSNPGTGLLADLKTQNKVLEAASKQMQLNDEGVLLFVFVPKIVGGQNLKGTEKLVMSRLDSLKAGNFSNDLLDMIKLDYKKQHAQMCENPTNRAMLILSSYAANYPSWEKYVEMQESYQRITKEDIVRVANKYFGENRLVFYNNRGLSWKAEKITKPPYKPIIPQNNDSTSAFAKKLAAMPNTSVNPIYIDFEKDFRKGEIKDKVHIVTSLNPMNDIFHLMLIFDKGTLKDSLLGLANSHIEELGTETKTVKEFKKAFQKIGSTYSLHADENNFLLVLTGFDEYLDTTLSLANELLTQVKPDDSQLDKLIQDKKAELKLQKKDQSLISDALEKYVLFQKNSPYLKGMTLKELKKVKSKDLTSAFKGLLQYETLVTYVGSLPFEDVKEKVSEKIAFGHNLLPSDTAYRAPVKYTQNTIYFCHSNKSNQANIAVYILGKEETDKDRLNAGLFNQYFGQGMSSVLFQEIREFRSLAYSAGGSYKMESRKFPSRKGYFWGEMSSQTDKTIEAIDILNELIANMPQNPERMDIIKSASEESINSSKPSFRTMPYYAYSWMDDGYAEDPRKQKLEYIKDATFEDITSFYTEFIKNRPVVYIITGNKKKIDLKALEQYGKVIEVSKKEIFE